MIEVIYGWVIIDVVCSKSFRNSQVYFTGIRWSNAGGIPVPEAARCTSQICERLLARIVASDRAGGMEVRFECRVFSGTGLCDELITRPEMSMARVRPQRYRKKNTVV